MNGSKAAKEATNYKYTMASRFRRWLFRRFDVPLPEVYLPEYIVTEYQPKGFSHYAPAGWICPKCDGYCASRGIKAPYPDSFEPLILTKQCKSCNELYELEY